MFSTRPPVGASRPPCLGSYPSTPPLYARPVPDVLVASDATWFHAEIRSELADPATTVRPVRSGAEVLPAMWDQLPDLVILDLQIGNMGGMATCLDIRLEEGA